MNLSVAIILDMVQSKRLVPTSRKYVERDLAPNGECQAGVRKLSLEILNELCSNLVDLIIRFELMPLGCAGVSANWTDVDHPISEFDKGASKQLTYIFSMPFLLRQEDHQTRLTS
jgi:hypothetical protein